MAENRSRDNWLEANAVKLAEAKAKAAAAGEPKNWQEQRDQKYVLVGPRLHRNVMLILGRPVVVPCEVSSSFCSLGWMLLLKIIYSAVHIIVSIVHHLVLRAVSLYVRLLSESSVLIILSFCFSYSSWRCLLICDILQVLVLTHANASKEEAVPYMQTHACMVHTLAGRSAKVEPEVDAPQAVHYGWKDVLLPVMTSGQVPEDTLFLVCEEDFRFDDKEPTIQKAAGKCLDRFFPQTQGGSLVEKHGLFGSWYLEDPVHAAFQKGKGTFPSLWQYRDREEQGAERSAAPDPPKRQGAERSAAPDKTSARKRPRQGAERSAASAETWGGSSGSTASPEHKGWWSQSLEDLVAYCNLAAKGKAGDVVWLSWCPPGRADDPGVKKEADLVPTHGTTCLGISVRGARAIARVLSQQKEAWHFDVWLRGKLDSKVLHAAVDGFGASYLWPPTGSYATHESGCQKGNAKQNKKQGLTKDGIREADWGYPNQPFTRVPRELIGTERNPGAGRPTEKWLGYALVKLGPRGPTEKGRRYLHGHTHSEAVVDLDRDMWQCLWWTFAAGSMMWLTYWWSPADRSKWHDAVQALYESVHYAAPDARTGSDGSQGAERSAAPDATRPRTRGERQLRGQNVWVSKRLDWDFCEAWV